MTLLSIFANSMFGQNLTEEIAKKACNCVEKDTSTSMDSKVTNCISTVIASDMQNNAKDMFDIQKLRQRLFDIKVKVYSSCEFVVLAQQKARENIYQGSKSDKAMQEFRKGNEFLLKNEYAKALPFFHKAVEQDSNFIEALDHIALCYRRTNDLTKAETYYKQSIKVEPKGQTAIQNLAIVYSNQNKPQQAIEQYQALLTVDMSNPEGYFGIARILVENNSGLDKALDLTNSAINIYTITKDPNLKDGLLIKGLIYYFTDDKKNAKKCLEEAKSKGAEIPAEIIKKLKIK